MCHVYGRDDTTNIANHQQEVEQRHKNLATDFTKRRNEIQAMQNSFTSFANSVDRFFEWLFDVESTVEQLENDVESSPMKKTTFIQKFEDVKVRVNSATYVFTNIKKILKKNVCIRALDRRRARGFKNYPLGPMAS